jgi:hypothetical protein
MAIGITSGGGSSLGGVGIDSTNISDGRVLKYNATTGKLEYADDLTATAGSGDASTNTATSVDGEVALFSGTTGKIIKRASGSGLAKLASGVLSVVNAPTGDVVGTSDAQTLTNKTITSPLGLVKGDVGLGNVDNFATASQAEAEAGSANDKFMTPLRVAEAISALGGGAATPASLSRNLLLLGE